MEEMLVELGNRKILFSVTPEKSLRKFIRGNKGIEGALLQKK
jgi:hypothetical protein